MVNYLPCKKCGSPHGMGVEDMETGEITPMDICYNCLWFGTHIPIKDQIILDHTVEANPYDEKLRKSQEKIIRDMLISCQSRVDSKDVM